MKKELFSILVITLALFIPCKAQQVATWPPTTNNPESTIDFTYDPAAQDILKSPILKQLGGTCWDFSALSFLQSDIYRQNKQQVDLSEVWVIYYTYLEKAINYAERDGHAQFSMGGEFFDVLHIMEKYGLAPESAAPWGKGPDVDRLNDKLTTFMQYVVAFHEIYDKYPERWMAEYTSILEKYLGKMPKSFEYDGKTHTPESFTQSLGIHADDYVDIMCDDRFASYQAIVVPFADNWLSGRAYNLPYAEFSQLPLYITQQKGGHFEWATDLSKPCWNFDMGLAVVPDKDIATLSEAELQPFWLRPVQEKAVTESIRQTGINQHSTTDDHGMHCMALTYDQNKQPYFLVRNSWGTDRNKCGGYTFASLAYVQKYTTMISVHKQFLSETLRKKLGIQSSTKH